MNRGGAKPLPFLYFDIMVKRKSLDVAAEPVAETVEAVSGQMAQPVEERRAADGGGDEIPANVKKVLACYPGYKELYVDRFGGVFPKGVQQNLVEGAILYQNPYFNK